MTKPTRAVGVILCLLSAGSVMPARSVAQPVRPSAINVNDRAAVLASYDAEFNRIEPSIGWTGDVSKCDGGTTSAEYQQSILQRVNWHRAMAGVAEVTYRSDLNAQQQAGALISAAEGKLSHTPAQSAKCWTQTGYNATSSSNLYLGVVGVRAMTGYVEDPGSNNAAAGHRWWVVHPMLKTITTGDTKEGNGSFGANALHVFDTASTPVQQPRDGFVAWPPPGYVPDDVVFPRWSVMVYGYSGVPTPDFTNATVTVTGPAGPLTVTYEEKSSGRIVFIPSGFQNAPLQVTSDQTYSVSVTGVTGGAVSSYSYVVKVVQANSAPYESGSSSYGRDACVTSNLLTSGPIIRDSDGDAITATLVSGEGDTDNAVFTLVENGGAWFLKPRNDLDGTRTKFSVRYRATDSKGAPMEKTFALTLVAAPSSGCPKKTTTTTTTTPAPNGSTVTRRTVSGTLVRGRTRTLTAFTTLPSGTRSYKVSGNCRLSSTKRSVTAPKTKGTCTVTVTGRTSTRTSILTLKLRVT